MIDILLISLSFFITRTSPLGKFQTTASDIVCYSCLWYKSVICPIHWLICLHHHVVSHLSNLCSCWTKIVPYFTWIAVPSPVCQRLSTATQFFFPVFLFHLTSYGNCNILVCISISLQATSICLCNLTASASHWISVSVTKMFISTAQ